MLSRVTAKNVGDVFLRHSVVVTSITGKSSIVSFRDSAHRISCERWIADKVVDMNSHSDDVIDMAASIILNDMRLTVYDCEQYEPLETTENGDKFIPNCLKRSCIICWIAKVRVALFQIGNAQQIQILHFIPTAWIIHVHCEAKKTAPFYFCNSFVRTSSFMTMFGTRIHQ